MAQFFGTPSKYLRSKDIKYYIIALVLLVLLIGFVYYLPKINSLFTYTIGPLASIVAIIVLLKILSEFITIFKNRSDNFHNGRMGEEDIKDVLSDLSDEYAVFRGIKFLNLGDVDFTVVGPTGIFTIDAKDFDKYTVGFNGQELTFNGRTFKKDILKQARNEAYNINKLIFEKINSNIFVEPVLVFSSYVKLNFGLNKQGGVYVIGAPYLINLITSKKILLSTEQVANIAKVLREEVEK